MKRSMVFALAVAAALSAAGYAVAHGNDGKSIKAVTATFSATSTSKVDSRSCTTSDGKTLVITDATYTGTASGDPDLTGAATVRARSAVNTTDGVGTVSGSIRIDVSGSDTRADFTSVYQGGHIGGLAVGNAHDPRARLIANLSADFSSAGGFTNGKLGASAGGGAVEVAPGRCQTVRQVKEQSRANGLVTAVSSTSITVAGLTCAVPAELQSQVTGLTVGSRVDIRCSFANGASTLVSVKKRK
jgi:hypothetical protein